MPDDQFVDTAIREQLAEAASKEVLVEQDGHLSVTFVDGHEELFLFKDITTWRPENGWLIVFYNNRSIRWPSHMIESVECFYNSADYVNSKPPAKDYYVCQGCGTHMVIPEVPV